MNNGISHSSIDSSIDKISQDNHNNIPDDNDEVSLLSETTQTGSESKSDDIPLANKVGRIDATGARLNWCNNTHSTVNHGRAARGVRTRGGYGRGIRNCGGGQGARDKGGGARGHGVQANQTGRLRNSCGGARFPLSIWRKG